MNLYGFVGNDGVNHSDYLGNGFWDIVSVIPFVGTAVHAARTITGNIPGVDVEDYNPGLDLDLCKNDWERAEIECKRRMQDQLTSYLLQAAGVGAVHDGIDVALALAAGRAGLLPLALALGIDAAADTALTFIDLGNIYDAYNEALDLGACECPELINCYPDYST